MASPAQNAAAEKQDRTRINEVRASEKRWRNGIEQARKRTRTERRHVSTLNIDVLGYSPTSGDCTRTLSNGISKLVGQHIGGP
jgi:hypothetical protein